MASVTSEEIAKWWPAFERNARRFDGLAGAEFDDLVQEQAEGMDRDGEGVLTLDPAS